MANNDYGWNPGNEIPPSLQPMVGLAMALQSSLPAREFIKNFALSAYKCGFDDATFAAQMNQMMSGDEEKGGSDADL